MNTGLKYRTARGTKGAKLTAILLIAVFAAGGAPGTPAISEQAQSEDFYNRVRASGTGYFEVGSSVVDKRIGLEYYSFIYGEGDLEMDSRSGVSTRAANLQGDLGGGPVPLNLLDDLKISYSGETPMVGTKSIHSKAFYGGIGAKVEERFEVTEMEGAQTTYFASTDPSSHTKDPGEAAALRGASPAHLVGMDLSTSFTGTWESDYRWHKIFYKDMKEHHTFSGVFDVQRTLRFSESPNSDPFNGLWS
jgi:hypothetical protein